MKKISWRKKSHSAPLRKKWCRYSRVPGQFWDIRYPPYRVPRAYVPAFGTLPPAPLPMVVLDVADLLGALDLFFYATQVARNHE